MEIFLEVLKYVVSAIIGGCSVSIYYRKKINKLKIKGNSNVISQGDYNMTAGRDLNVKK